MSHFDSFNKKQKINYIEQAKSKFEESLKPLTGQLIRLFADGDFTHHEAAVKALVKRSGRCYNEYVMEAGSEEREKIALEEGRQWLASLSQAAYATLIARYPSIHKGYNEGKE